MSQPCWDHKPISIKKNNNKTKWLSMVPNARLTRKWCSFGHLNLIITFSMHSIRILESFISMKCCRVLVIKIVIPWVMGLNQAHAFTKRFIKSSWSMEVTILQKLGQKMDRVTSLLRLLPNTFRTVISLLLPVSPWQRCHGPCWKSKLIQPHILRKNLQYFNYASFAYIHAFHWLHCSLHSFLEKKKRT